MNNCSLPLLVLLLTAGFLPAQTPEEETVLDLEGEGLSVVGTVEVNQRMQVVDRDAIVRAGAPDVPSLLEKTLGLSQTRNGGYGNQSSISLRGFGSGRVAILIDGVPVNSAQSGDFDLSRIPVAALEKIEVIWGGSDSKYNINGAIGGVINLITVRQPEPGVTWGTSLSNKASFPDAGSSSYADTQTGDLHLAGADDDGFWTLGLTAARAANEYGYTDDTGARRWWKGNEVVDAGLTATLGRNFPEERRLLVSANGYYGAKDVPGPVNSATPGKQVEVSTRTSAVWSDASVGSDSLSTNLNLSHRLTALEWTDPSTHSVHQLHTFGVVDRWEWVVGSDLTVQAGGDLDSSFLWSNTVGNVVDFSGGAWVTAPWKPGAEGEVIPSVKAVFAQGLGSPILVPKLGLVYRTADGTLKNNYFRTFKLPTINDRYWPEDSYARGNPDLGPEDGVGTDVIWTAGDPEGFSYEAAVYATWHQNAIAWQPAAGRWSPRNIGEAVYAGAEASVKVPLGTAFTATAQYAFLATRVLTGDLTWADGVEMPYKPQHIATLGLDHRWASGTINVTGHGESPRFVSLANLSSLPAFFTLDVSMDQKVGKDVSLFLSGRNLLNQSYFTVDGYPMPGGSLTVGVRYGSGD